MNLSIRMRVSIAAGVVVAAALVGCQTTRDYVDRLPRPSMPSLDSIVPFRKSKTPTHAEPYQPPKLEPVPDSQGPLILPAPSSTNTPGRAKSRRVSTPPALPPFDPETPVPSAGLFPSGPIRRMGFETSSVIKDSNIIQTGCCAPIVQSCCPPPCCPTPCCETSCCSTGCGLSSLLGTVTTPFYVAKYKIQNAKARLHCRLSAIGSCCSPCSSPCCAPCAPSCSPCGSCVSNEYVMEGVVVNQYPLNRGCSPCSTGMNSVPQIPMHYQAAPQQPWRQPAQQFRRPQAPCGCQNQQAAQYPAPQHQHPSQQYYAPRQRAQTPPQYQGARPTYPQPQVVVRQPVVQPQYQPTYRPTPAPQQRVAQPNQYRPQQPAPQQQQQPFNNQSAAAPVAQPRQDYPAPQPVQPVKPQEPTADTAKPEPAPQTSSLVPGHSPLTSSPSRVARVYRATRFQ
jgi:hypothetical protein